MGQAGQADLVDQEVQVALVDLLDQVVQLGQVVQVALEHFRARRLGQAPGSEPHLPLMPSSISRQTGLQPGG